MERIDDQVVNNRLLLALPREALERLRPALRGVALLQGQTIDRVDAPIEFLYFVNRGFISMVKTMRDGRAVEIGGIGVEGVTAPNSLFGIDEAVFDSLVQVAGSAFRIRRDVLKSEAWPGTALHELMGNYARFVLGQVGQTAACNRLHSVEERCCRWLLVAADNARSDHFALTHEYLAMMLGAQRSGVSIAMRALKRAGLVDYARGVVTILDREGLEEAACECHRAAKDAIDAVFGSRGGAAGMAVASV